MIYALVAAALALNPTGAREVASQMQVQRALGYHPCTPTVISEDKIDAAGGWAAWPETYGECTIALDTAITAEFTAYVARHEVCHLSTGPAVARDPVWMLISDAYHVHPAFAICMAMTGGDTV